MVSERRKLRVTVITEDSRSRSFLHALLTSVGFEPRNIYHRPAPSGRGSAERWVMQQYPGEVQVLRSKNYQAGLRLVVVRDGDRAGYAQRMADFDTALANNKMKVREEAEKIAHLVPTWSIETWLFALLGDAGVDESEPMKTRFHGTRTEIRKAAAAWPTTARISSLPSLAGACDELQRIDP